MSEIQEIEIFILPDGTVKTEVHGVSGKKCLDITRSIEEALGGVVVNRELCPEYHDSEQNIDNQTFQSQNG